MKKKKNSCNCSDNDDEGLSVKVVLLGDSGVGKTSLVIRYARGTFHPFQEPTIGAAFVSYAEFVRDDDDDDDNGVAVDQDGRGGGSGESNDNTSSRMMENTATSGNKKKNTNKKKKDKGSKPVHKGEKVTFKLWDTAGQERYHSLTPLYFRGAHVALLVFDICRLHSFQTLHNWARQVRNYNPEILIVVVGNKADLESHRSVSKAQAKQFAASIQAILYMETSAKENLQVKQVFQQIARRALQMIPNQQESQQQQQESQQQQQARERSASSSSRTVDLSAAAAASTTTSSYFSSCC